MPRIILSPRSYRIQAIQIELEYVSLLNPKLSPPAANVIEIFILILIVIPTWYPETGMRWFSKADSQQLKETAIDRDKNKISKRQTKVSHITKDVRVLSSE